MTKEGLAELGLSETDVLDRLVEKLFERAITEALGNVNSSVRKGLEEAVKIALANIKVNVNTEVKT